MKRFFTAVATLMMLVGVVDASAQGHRPPRRHHHHDIHSVSDGLGISFGYLHSAYRNYDWATESIDANDRFNGFTVALTKDFTLIDQMLYIQTGLEYIYQNQSNNQSLGGLKLIGDWNEHLMNIPVKIKYEIPVLADMNVFIMGGPSIMEGLSSRIKYRANMGGVNAATSYNCYNAKIRSNSGELDSIINPFLPVSRYRRFDVQFGLSAGVRFFEYFEAQIGYDWGVVNKFKDETDGDLKRRRQQLYITVGVRF